ncbi:hypothetical protein NAT51_05315 [Flavobacterium amniphilum]|uniref:hypothetical protein n=1 Tax=Flavobacterium amniphilum TaxID=1834035 RepID=UPI00202AAB4B|nr:hypothetical protein [Flavobacterium amniphilum]MCL9804927.1 hypothetical protein [Flavobacterium amniphilum]
MKKIGLLIAVFPLIQSCQYFEKNVPAKEELLQKELNKINWDEVDEYPSTTECDSITDKLQRKQCFFDYVSSQLELHLNNDTIKSLYPKQDTLKVKVTVLPDAMITFVSHFDIDTLSFDKVKADSVLQSKLSDFPLMEPAIKRGIKVKSEFIIPVVLK